MFDLILQFLDDVFGDAEAPCSLPEDAGGTSLEALAGPAADACSPPTVDTYGAAAGTSAPVEPAPLPAAATTLAVPSSADTGGSGWDPVLPQTLVTPSGRGGIELTPTPDGQGYTITVHADPTPPATAPSDAWLTAEPNVNPVDPFTGYADYDHDGRRDWEDATPTDPSRS